jgi:hypothetical protein
MAVDYNKPTIDQTRRDAINQIRENFQGLAAQVGGQFLPLSGGTLTGNLIVANPTAHTVVALTPAAGFSTYMGVGTSPRQFWMLDVKNPLGEAVISLENGVARHMMQMRVTGAAYVFEGRQIQEDGGDPGGPSYQTGFQFYLRDQAGAKFVALQINNNGQVNTIGDVSCRNVYTRHLAIDSSPTLTHDAGYAKSITINAVTAMPSMVIDINNVKVGDVVRIAVRGAASVITALRCMGSPVWWPKGGQTLPTDLMSGPLQCTAISLFYFTDGYCMATYTPF